MEPILPWTGLDSISSVIETVDGGFAMCGFTPSFRNTGHDAWLIKLDSNGNMQWNKSFGERENDWAKAIFQAVDSGFVVIDSKQLSRSGNVSWVIDVDSEGNEQWNKTYGDKSIDNRFTDAIKTSDGYALVGYSVFTSKETSWLLKINSMGDPQWKNHMVNPVIVR